jgi:hypothetical protein
MKIQTLTLPPRSAALPPHERIKLARRDMPGAEYFTLAKNIVFGFPSNPNYNPAARLTPGRIFNRKGEPV